MWNVRAVIEEARRTAKETGESVRDEIEHIVGPVTVDIIMRKLEVADWKRSGFFKRAGLLDGIPVRPTEGAVLGASLSGRRTSPTAALTILGLALLVGWGMKR